jgi:hypothetical protein
MTLPLLVFYGTKFDAKKYMPNATLNAWRLAMKNEQAASRRAAFAAYLKIA